MDPRRPRFHKINDPHVNILGQNTNAVFYGANLDSTKSYLVRGRVVAEDYFSVILKQAECEGCFFKNTIAAIDDRQLKLGKSYRNFEVFLSAKAPPAHFQGDWISLADAPQGLPLQLVTQHYYEHRASMPQLHHLSITLADPASGLALPSPRAAIPSDADMAQKLRAIKTVIQKHTQARAQGLAPTSTLSFQAEQRAQTVSFQSVEANDNGGSDLKYWHASVQLKLVGGGGGCRALR